MLFEIVQAWLPSQKKRSAAEAFWFNRETVVLAAAKVAGRTAAAVVVQETTRVSAPAALTQANRSSAIRNLIFTPKPWRLGHRRHQRHSFLLFGPRASLLRLEEVRVPEEVPIDLQVC
jgi:hypothetical protein